MKRHILIMAATAVLIIYTAVPAFSQYEGYREGVDYSRYIKYDRYLDVEVWTDDDEYYDGENVTISFRADKDCYVVVYNIDTRGRVHLLYPADQWDDVKIERDRIYRIPDSYDDYDLTVRGPEGIEYIQIVASQQPIPIPDWDADRYLVAYDDPVDYMEYINAVYFGLDDCYLSFDMTMFSVEEWNQAYFRPVHVYHNYAWDLCGTVYIDYPWGATVYIDGIYWGVAPLFIPRIYWGWHYITIYDHYGYCWEERINVYRRRTIYLDETIVKTRSGVKSKYRDVRSKGYINPTKNGYPEFDKQVRAKKEAMTAYKSKRSRTESYRDPASVDSKRATVSKFNQSQRSAGKTRSATMERHSKSRPSQSTSSQRTERKRSAVKERSSDRGSAAKRYESTRSSNKADRSSGTSRSRSYDSRGKSSSGKSSSSGTYKRSSSSSRSSSGSSKSSKSGSSGRSGNSGGSDNGKSGRGR